MPSSIRNRLASAAIRLARTSAGKRLLNRMISKMSFALPFEILLETENLLAFYHPQPSYALHILLAPKKEITGLADLGEMDQPFMHDLFAAVQQLIDRFELGKSGYRLIANGGAYQDFPRLHFHLVSGAPTQQPAE